MQCNPFQTKKNSGIPIFHHYEIEKLTFLHITVPLPLILGQSLTSDVYIKYYIHAMQYDHEWLEGSSMSYQDWFYPWKQANCLFTWQNRQHDATSIRSPEIPLHHKYFQPQVRNDFNCSALAITGYNMVTNWQWIMINCSKIYKRSYYCM